ncbi:methyltransferase-like protein 27 [Pomacea canaliculata]|uniref:methyltransferase-like protein 27 n=1 Tax=Pomacea canaliculata TaxID=400727 RepID=UPI000D730BC7|nr:methyltransferase-like protein 27 [Pomacea canaliculata]
MLDVARKKGIYRQFFNVALTAEPVDLPADTYDAVVLVGVILYGHLPCDAFLEMTRLVKSGGYIVNCMRADYLQDIPEYAERWETLMTRMIQENTWKVVKYEKYPNHFLGRDGLLMVFQVNK